MATARFYCLMSFVVVASGACNGPTRPDDEPNEDVGEVGQALEVTSVDLSQYVLTGRFDLPEPTRTTPPNSISLLAQEASSVTYNWDTNTLFVVGDSGTAVTQVSKTGALIDSMTLASGSSPQGTEFYDTEGIAYVGGGQFVFTEERYRQVVKWNYVAGSTLNRAATQTVKLGTTIGNVGLEAVTYDPVANTYIFLKEKDPKSIFETSIDFAAGSASNGSPTTVNSVDLFSPALVDTLDFSDIFALSNLPALSGNPAYNQLLILSQESGKIVQVDRSGSVQHTLTIVAAPTDTLAVPDMTMEGITMDRDGNLYVVNENGGGDSAHPQLWVYSPSTATNVAPTAVALTGAVTSLPEGTNTTIAVNLAQIAVADDGLGDNTLLVSGPDASAFEIVGTALFLKAGTTLNATTKPTYQISVSVDDTSVGATPDASTAYTLTITPASSGGAVLAITEVAPWASGNSPLACDWFEVTNVGTAAVTLTGWTMDDNSNSSALGVPLNGVTTINAGESVIFMETTPATLATKAQQLRDLWFGASPPAGLKIGSYSGSGVGLSTGGDSVNLFDSTGAVRANVSFGASPGSPPYASFDNSAAANNVTVSTLSVVGQYGAFTAVNSSNEIGSPGTTGGGATVLVGITAPDNQASETGSAPGVFRFTRSGSTTSPLTVAYTLATGSGSASAADYTPTLTGTQVIPSGAAFIDVTITPVDDTTFEGAETLNITLTDTGSYDVGADASASITIADNDSAPAGRLVITEAAPWASGNSSLAVDWFELTNIGNAAISISGWKIDDDSNSSSAAVALAGVTNINPGESVVFMETTASNLASKAAQFRSLWFGSSPPSGLQIGNYTGSGIGLGTGGDALNLFDNTNVRRANVTFGASPGSAPYATFDNGAGLDNVAITTLSVVGTRGAFVAAGTANEVGSPGVIANAAPVLVGITATDDQASEAGSGVGVFRFTRTGATSSALSVTYAVATGSGQASASDYSPTLTGTQVIPPGAAFVDVTITPVDDALVEGSETVSLTVTDTASYDLDTSASATVTIQDNDVANLPPTAVALINTVPSISEAASVSSPVFMADISVTDDGQGSNTLSLSGPDASSFELNGFSLFLKAGTVLDHNTRPTLSVTVGVDDVTVGATPDVTANFTLGVTAVAGTGLVVTEVAPWSSSGPLARDWFEVTNTTSAPIIITGWKVDDNSHGLATAVALNGIATIAPGEAVIFIEAAAADLPAAATAFRNLWFGTKVQPAPQIGSYTGSGIGLSGSGDEVTLFNAAGELVTGVGFGASASAAPFATFDNHAGVGSNLLPVPVLTTFSVVGVNRAFVAAADSGETGSPGIGNVGRLLVTEIVPWSSGSAPYAADWFEVTNVGSEPVDITGWKMDDSSNAFATAAPISGVGIIPPGKSAVLLEGTASVTAPFLTAWFGSSPPAEFLVGSYTGSGVGLSTGGDAVNLFDTVGNRITGVSFGTATDLFSFDNAAGAGTVLTLSSIGINGAFLAADGTETGSPGTVENPPTPVAVPVLPAKWLAVLGLLLLGGGMIAARVPARRVVRA